MFQNTAGITPFAEKVWLASPKMHGEELRYMTEAYETNWMSTVGANLDAVEDIVCAKTGSACGVALSSGTAALHMAVKHAGERLYGRPAVGSGALSGRRVFCSDLTFAATVNPIVYEGGIPVFIDAEQDSWNMDPAALEAAFRRYPEVKLIVAVHLYGTPAKMDAIRAIADRHGALIVEDAAESFGAAYAGQQTGTLGDYGVISFNGNKIITGSSGGMLLTADAAAAQQVRKWSTQSREAAAWYQHQELGYNYRMSNVVAGVVRGQLQHLEEHIAWKKAIYQRYADGFHDLPVTMNPHLAQTEPNAWLSCLLIRPEAMCRQVRGEQDALYHREPGKTCPTEILEVLQRYRAEGRPLWKPMHLQPIYRNHDFISGAADVGTDLFQRGLCLPSDINMTEEQQAVVIELVRRCFA